MRDTGEVSPVIRSNSLLEVLLQNFRPHIHYTRWEVKHAYLVKRIGEHDIAL